MSLTSTTDLDTARRHVMEAERRVANQMDVIVRLAKDGHDTKAAEELLQTFRGTLETMRKHLKLEEEFVRGGGG